MRKPILLDLFCGAGGCARGYQEAGFEVFGVDSKPQPNYAGDRFVQADALMFLDRMLAGGTFEWIGPGIIAAVHASPPCQRHSDLQRRTGREYPELIAPTRERLVGWALQWEVPYVIENVEGAPLLDPVVLCGTMFDGLRVIRHRLFETNWPLTPPPHPAGPHPKVFTYDKRKAHFGQLDQDTSYVQVTGGGNCTLANARDAMGIDWMCKGEINEAIPPAYTSFVGGQIRRHLDSCDRQASKSGSASSRRSSSLPASPAGSTASPSSTGSAPSSFGTSSTKQEAA
jgi:DNA (cytosine-5)-methyltransferase 1